jgi:hypothetical protein
MLAQGVDVVCSVVNTSNRCDVGGSAQLARVAATMAILRRVTTCDQGLGLNQR